MDIKCLRCWSLVVALLIAGCSGGGGGVANSITLDAAGSICITGNTSGILSSSTDETSPPDIFIAKYNSSGTELWIVQPGYLPDAQASYDIAIDSIGNSYITGYTTGDVTSDNSYEGSYDVFVMKLVL